METRCHIDPLPRYMHPQLYEHRRKARAKAHDRYSDIEGAFFVDAAGPVCGKHTAAVIPQGRQIDCISAQNTDATSMEDAGIAVTLRNPGSIFILTDSQAAYRNFSKGQIGPLAHRILTQLLSQRSEREWKQLIWIPGHCGVKGNKLAHVSNR
ncbi:hypothetical protein HPB50_007781 [Hyalomma asiaticum]|uniref:Uncharacterized protein n=1 Tax=Hyalomma asiaticum TaxID=266040 RepID=A0ACB7RN58_HYAAI|nr:hypothetical protein HPB50_007781 [Hyalomma asiaticum]